MGEPLMVAGFLIYLVGALWLLVVEFNTSIIWFLVGFFLCHLAHLLFFFLYFKQAKVPFAIMAAGTALTAYGKWLTLQP